MAKLNQLKEDIVNEILMYLEGYTELHPDDLFALKQDLPQIVIDKVEEMKDYSR
jgi:hypothetical protein